jgi:3-methyladenine DNA glycosylase AlkD
MLARLRKDLKKLADPGKAKILSRFFKTGKGEYGEGDVFYGIILPDSRRIAKEYSGLSLKDIASLLKSKIHEERLVALLILVRKFRKADEALRKQIYRFFLANTKYVNNWDLVDLTAPKIVGEFLKDKDRSVLISLARSKNVWERRISIIATYRFIKDLKESGDTFKIAKMLMNDKHDIIHKAVGWMLKEIGNRISQQKEEEFLRPQYKSMPRTALRYAIEKFPEQKRKKYLKGKV